MIKKGNDVANMELKPRNISGDLEYTFFIKHRENDNIILDTFKNGVPFQIDFDLKNNTCNHKQGTVEDVGLDWKRCIFRSSETLDNFFGVLA